MLSCGSIQLSVATLPPNLPQLSTQSAAFSIYSYFIYEGLPAEERGVPTGHGW
jgi:hypothetical protein